ncbi:phosphocholine-specific phospholipase C [Aeromicrobium sp.]|uniref:phosphocholine-specific phospholipase C n=1 Tax=Aeromicrobium sp. TaxID=1871063 RepID=UPI00199AE5D4|nr:phospholipase C, phosphocholine-specific [Aeromicrobium sp.]MBC7631734.1 phospholipase C, phosphocholine-specific [Aeromicrobium sp.]
MTQLSGPSRRQVLKAGGAVLAAGSLLPASVHQAMAASPRRGGLRAVEHVILLMQENRSFDHYYGRLRGVRGYGDRHLLRQRDGSSVLAQKVAAGTGEGVAHVLPFSLREAAVAAGRPVGDIQYLDALPHGFTDATDAWSKGWWDRWVPAKGKASMTYYDRADVPLQYELSETFTTLDAYHCSVFGSTNPNRNYFWTGTTGHEPDSVKRAVSNAAYSYDHAGYSWTTYPERLEAAGVSWQIYQEWDNFTDNAVEYFTPFKRIGTKMLAHVTGTYRTTEEFYDSLHGKSSAEQDALLAQLETGRAKLSPPERGLFDKAMYRSRPGTMLERFGADVKADTLPTVTWLVPPAALSEHPSVSTPVGSANLIYDLLDVVASDRETWASSAVLLNFDENDGFFDHVPPPVAPRPASGNDDDWYDGRPVGLGPRVPMTIVSPWTVGGFVDSSVADHTSTIRFLEAVTGVAEPNISQWRRRICSDLTTAFDWDGHARRPEVTLPGPVPKAIDRWRPEPPADQDVPTQERGRRPARPLPYQPSVSASVERGQLALVLANGGRQALSFTVYPYTGGPADPVFVPVERGREQLRVEPLDGRWDLAVQGPNGFWCELAGSLAGRAAGVDVRASARPWRSGLALELVNGSRHAVSLLLEPGDYSGQRRLVRLRPGGREDLPWPTDRGWHDIQITSPDDDSFRRRLTGRVETGRPTLTA